MKKETLFRLAKHTAFLEDELKDYESLYREFLITVQKYLKTKI